MDLLACLHARPRASYMATWHDFSRLCWATVVPPRHGAGRGTSALCIGIRALYIPAWPFACRMRSWWGCCCSMAVTQTRAARQGLPALASKLAWARGWAGTAPPPVAVPPVWHHGLTLLPSCACPSHWGLPWSRLVSAAGDQQLQGGPWRRCWIPTTALALPMLHAVPARGASPLHLSAGLCLTAVLAPFDSPRCIRPQDFASPLAQAAAGGMVSIVELLLGKGAAVDAADEQGWTPLMLAVRRGKGAAVRACIQAGADVARQNAQGDTALHLAAINNRAEIAQQLLAAGGASRVLGLRNGDGQTPAEAARTPEVAALLQAAVTAPGL